MKVGLDTYCYQVAHAAGTYDVFRVIDRAASLGVEGLQININGRNGRFLGADPGDAHHVRKVRDALEENGLFVEVAGRSTRPDMLGWQLRLCSDLGAGILRTVVVLEDTIEQTTQGAQRDLEAVLPLAHQLGVRIALENHEDLTAGELASIIEAVDDDHLGVCLDTGNGLCVYEDPIETVTQLAPYAITSHVKDQRLVRLEGVVYSVGVKLGLGSIDLPAVIDMLLERSSLDRLLIQDTVGYGIPLNPFNRRLEPSDNLPGIRDVTQEEMEREDLVISLKGLAEEELGSLARAKEGYIEEDIAYLRSVLGKR
jgi:sugar phosphate isomerase/epimerase